MLAFLFTKVSFFPVKEASTNIYVSSTCEISLSLGEEMKNGWLETVHSFLLLQALKQYIHEIRRIKLIM